MGVDIAKTFNPIPSDALKGFDIDFNSFLNVGSPSNPNDVVVSSEKTKTTTAGTSGVETTQSETKKVVNTDIVSSWLVRGVVVLLGFIFVAVGLTMFKSGDSVTVVMKNAAGKVTA